MFTVIIIAKILVLSEENTIFRISYFSSHMLVDDI
jgi:hypothetical protein